MIRMTKLSRLVLTLALVLVSTTAMGQSMKMVVDSNGKLVGRYVSSDATTYTVCVQDDVKVPKKGHSVVTYSAQNGQGIIYRDQSRKGNINVRKQPTTNSAVVAKIADNTIEGCVPDTYPCLGKTNGWYKIRIDGKVGYVREDLVEWDGMNTF